jgi:broad specificity phosphatase PhoE
MKIFLCRHGQTTGDIEDRFGGDYDDHLTGKGKIQAQALALKLKGKGIEEIFSSSLIRAKETSEIIDSEIKAGIKILADIRERNHNGVITGMIRSEAQKMYPEEVEKVKNYHTHATGGEDYRDFVKRVSAAWDTVLSSGYEKVAVISHGGPIRVIFREVLKIGEIKVEDCAYAEIDVTDGKGNIVSLDGIAIQ